VFYGIWFQVKVMAFGSSNNHSAIVALESPFAIYNVRFELGLGQSMVRLSTYFVHAYVWRQLHMSIFSQNWISEYPFYFDLG
jgi:hypothetical protein